MVNFKVQGESRQILSLWEDVSVAKLHTFPDAPRDQIKHFSNLTDQEVKALNSDQVLAFMSILEFMEDEPKGAKVKKDINVAGESWGKIERAKMALQSRNKWSYCVELCVIYFGDKALTWSIGLIYGQSINILNSLSVFLERYKDLNDNKGYSEQEIDAGVKDLESFGVGAVRYSLASGDLTKYADIEDKDAETVYFHLLYSKAVAMYQERLSEIKKLSGNEHT